MDSIEVTNNSSDLIEIAARYLDSTVDLRAARVKLVQNAVEESGSLIIRLIEGLGENIDLYI